VANVTAVSNVTALANVSDVADVSAVANVSAWAKAISSARDIAMVNPDVKEINDIYQTYGLLGVCFLAALYIIAAKLKAKLHQWMVMQQHANAEAYHLLV
jgi:hypothetical protein